MTGNRPPQFFVQVAARLMRKHASRKPWTGLLERWFPDTAAAVDKEIGHRLLPDWWYADEPPQKSPRPTVVPAVRVEQPVELAPAAPPEVLLTPEGVQPPAEVPPETVPTEDDLLARRPAP